VDVRKAVIIMKQRQWLCKKHIEETRELKNYANF